MSASTPINVVQTGTLADFKVYPELFFSGYNEILQQNGQVFNANSNNTMRFEVRGIQGEFSQASFYKVIEGLVQERDPSSLAPVESKKLEQGELVSPKLNRRIGPIRNTMDSFKKISRDPEEFSFVLGQQYAQEQLLDLVNTATLSTVTAIETVSPLVTDATGLASPGIRAEYLIRAMSKFGDKAQRVNAWVMHSGAYHTLMENQAATGYTNVSDVIIYGGAPGTLGKPVIVTDSPALTIVDVNGDVVGYNILGLTENGVVLTESEDRYITSKEELGRENIIMIIQGEAAMNISVKGFSYVGGANPSNTALATGANWEFQMHDPKLAAGVLLKVGIEDSVND